MRTWRVLAVLPFICQAQFSSRFSSEDLPADSISTYVVPNETQPQAIAPLIAGAPSGAYVSVGSERSFIGASLIEQTTHLLQIDADPMTLMFNRVNTALLALAAKGDRENYRHLRFNASFDDWQAALNARDLLPEYKNLLSRMDVWKWWKLYFRDYGGYWSFGINAKKWGYFLAPEKRTTPDREEFEKGVYLFSDEKFSRLQKLASTGRIIQLKVDLNNSESLSTLFNELKQQKIPLSVLDVSNAWEETFTKKMALEHLLKVSSSVADSGSVFLTSVKLSLLKLPTPRNGWGYRGYTFEYISGKGISKVASEIKNPWLGLMRFKKIGLKCGEALKVTP
jgi:hypothetical protein